MTITVPKGHQIGMRVPVGGSSCAKCEYVSDDKTSCGQKLFQKWNGEKTLPAKADRYCCDFFEAEEGRGTLGEQMKEQRAEKGK